MDYSFELLGNGSVVDTVGGADVPLGYVAVTFSLAVLEENKGSLFNTTAEPHFARFTRAGFLSDAAEPNAFPVLAAGTGLAMVVLSVIFLTKWS